MEHSAGAPTGTSAEVRRLEERAFMEVQRADTKATALCGVAGGFLAAGVAVLSGTKGVPLACVLLLVLMCVLFVCAVAVALCALRPVVPRAGLRAELAGGAAGCLGHGLPREACGHREAQLQARRLWVLACLADRKLRSVRVAVDLVLAALVVAGMCLLSGFVFD